MQRCMERKFRREALLLDHRDPTSPAAARLERSRRWARTDRELVERSRRRLAGFTGGLPHVGFQCGRTSIEAPCVGTPAADRDAVTRTTVRPWSRASVCLRPGLKAGRQRWEGRRGSTRVSANTCAHGRPGGALPRAAPGKAGWRRRRPKVIVRFHARQADSSARQRAQERGRGDASRSKSVPTRSRRLPHRRAGPAIFSALRGPGARGASQPFRSADPMPPSRLTQRAPVGWRPARSRPAVPRSCNPITAVPRGIGHGARA
jgi:hypothetical protein